MLRLFPLLILSLLASADAAVMKGIFSSPPNAGFVLPQMPLYLAVPDSMGGLALPELLTRPDSAFNRILNRKAIQGKVPTAVEKKYIEALKALVDGRVGDARRYWQQARGGKWDQEQHAALATNAAIMLFAVGLHSQAEAEFREITRQFPVYPAAWLNLYSMALAKGDVNTAWHWLEARLGVDPRDEWAIIGKAYLWSRAGRHELAEAHLREYSAWQDSLPQVQLVYARLLKESGRLTEAARYYGLGLESRSGEGESWLELADVYFQKGWLVFAHQCIVKAFREGISTFYAYELFGKVLADFNTRESWKGAERVLEDGLPKDPHSRALAQLLYHAYARNGEVEKARNLRAQVWFHFTAPYPVARVPSLRFKQGHRFSGDATGLHYRLSYITAPLLIAFTRNDFLSFESTLP